MWLTAVVLVATAVLLVLFSWPKSPRQIITLANGDQYEFAGTTYGTNLVPPSILCRIANHLPVALTNFAARLFGDRIRWARGLAPDQPELTIWFRRLKTTNSNPVAFSRTPVLVAGLADEENSELGREHYAIFNLNFPERTMFADPAVGWSCLTLGNIPKRSPVLHVLFHHDVASDPQQITLRNPFYGDYPQWEPKDALPASRDIEDLHVEVGKFESSTYAASNVQIQVSWPPRPAFPPEWDILSAGLDDATGNHLDPNPPQGFVSGSAGRILNFPLDFWPGEDAWRLKVVFKRVDVYPPASVLTFKNVPIPPVGSTNFVPITNQLEGIKVRISQFTHTTNSTHPPYSTIIVDLPDQPADMRAEIIAVETPGLDARIYPTPEVQLNDLLANAASVNITVVVQKLRTLELYIKPPEL